MCNKVPLRCLLLANYESSCRCTDEKVSGYFKKVVKFLPFSVREFLSLRLWWAGFKVY